MDISVVIPLFNEEESLPELYAWIERVMQANGFSFEVIFVNDGSTDHSWEVIEKFKAQSEHVKGIKFRRNYGKSPALYCGFAEAEGNVVITMDADLQDSPDEIPELYRMITRMATTWYPAGSKRDMILFQKHCPPSCLMLLPAKYQASKTCTTSTAD